MEGKPEGENTGNDPRSAVAATLSSLPPSHVIFDLLSVGVCIRCILRMFRVHGHVYACRELTATLLWSVVEESKVSSTISCENSLPSNGSSSRSFVSQAAESQQAYCCVCLGILQFIYNDEPETCRVTEKDNVDNFLFMVSGYLKTEGHDVDGFFLEVSVPPVISANERAIWIYIKNKYESADWFREKFMDHISVKDALKLSINSALEKHLGVKMGSSSFRIRLIYSHSKASSDLQSSLAKALGSKKRKTEFSRTVIKNFDNGTRNEETKNETDTATYKTLSGLPDEIFCEHFLLPPEKPKERCLVKTECYRLPIYIGGRYLKFSRKVSQTRWIIDDERMGEASIEEIIGGNVLPVCKGDTYKFHAAGREDIDVRMLGSGRPFLIEVSNARHIPSAADVGEIAEKINDSGYKYVKVKNLRALGSEAWALMREGEAEKQKQYAALVWISRPFLEEDQQKINSIRNMEILQRTPIRVLHRRSPIDRKRIIHWMRAEKMNENSQYFLLHLCTQAGTYIKEFVHGDLGRTYPSVGTLLGCRAEILQLDVTDVKMDCFD